MVINSMSYQNYFELVDYTIFMYGKSYPWKLSIVKNKYYKIICTVYSNQEFTQYTCY